MKAEIISIGSELTSGQNLDTNSQWLSVELAKIGVPVHYHTTVADDLDTNIAVLRHAVERAELVVVTGGLGPTQDDLTREAMAALAGVGLVFHEPSFEAIRERFARRKREMPERNRVQAYFPEGSEPIPNPHGTAPGIWMAVRRTGSGDLVPLAAMPGVPYEMYRMFEEQVRARLVASFGGRGVLVQRKINAFGLGESDIESRLLDLTARGRVPEVGITVHDGVISLRIIARGQDEPAALEAAQPTADLIYARLGTLIFGEQGETLAGAVAKALDAHGQTLAVAEGCTGGLVAARLGEIPGASRWFRGGVVAYANDAKTRLLDVPADLLQEHGAVSEPVVRSMAAACRRHFASDLAVAVTGIAGPGGGTPDKPVGTVCVAVSCGDQLTTQTLHIIGDSRMSRQSRAAQHALNQVRLRLLQP